MAWAKPVGPMMTASGNETEIDAIRRQLAALDTERQGLEARLRLLEQSLVAGAPNATLKPSITNASPATEKIALFRRLFAGPWGS
jgi:hypothetical protein